MRFENLLTSADREGLRGWLANSPTGDLFVCLEHPHSGGPGPWCLIRSIEELDAILAAADCWQELELDVFSQSQFALRGIADERLAHRAATELPDGDWYAVVALPPDRPPAQELEVIGTTDEKGELADLIRSASGAPVGVGLHPLEGGRDSRRNAELVFYVGLHRNRNQWPPYK
ncbi:MAG TPA: hypothetical protein VH394_12470 [Thermoanaerobaculia bacterium]|jgi:hypothetical protein|nr:hypothetical protein [Thermoanaerobaculia bacterium]